MDQPTIIANARIVFCDSANRGGTYSLLIRGKRIAAISAKPDAFIAMHPHATVMDASNKVVTPGFVNAHVHSDSLVLRDRTDGVHYALWQNDAEIRRRREVLYSPSGYDDVRNIFLAVYFAHLKSGVTCVGEFCPPVDGVAFSGLVQAITRTGVRSLLTLQNWDQIEYARSHLKSGHRYSVNLGKEDEFTVYSFENYVRAAHELELPLTAHVAEQRDDVDIVRKNWQKAMLGLLRDFDALHATTILVHLNHLTAHEVRMMEERELSAVVCPRSTAQKQTGYPSLRHLLSHRVRLAVGTDWGSTDVVEDLRFMHQLPLLVPGVRQISGLELIRMATINGAAALGLASEIGSIETGKRADLVFFDLADIRVPTLHTDSVHSLADHVVRHLSVYHISDVMIDGEFQVRQGQIMTMAEEDLVTSFRTTYERLAQEGASLGHAPRSSGNVAEPDVAKVLPFLAAKRLQTPQGFEEGVEVSQAQDAGNHDVNLVAPTPASETVVSRPKVPTKEIDRVFGEDDF